MSPTGNETSQRKLEALIWMEETGSSIRKAAEEFGISKTVLGRALKSLNGVSPSEFKEQGKSFTPQGAPTILTLEEESLIADTILESQKNMHCYTRAGVKSLALYIVRKRPPEVRKQDDVAIASWEERGMASNKWLNLFLKRHPELSQRVADPICRERAHITKPMVDDFFLRIKPLLEKTAPGWIFNCDETGWNIFKEKVLVIAQKGSRSARRAENTDRRGISLMLCVSAAGVVLSVLVIIPGVARRAPAWLAREGLKWSDTETTRTMRFIQQVKI